MNPDPELMALDELPDEARAVIDEAERAVATVRSRMEAETAAVRDRADQECAAIRARADAEAATVQQAATRELAPLVRNLVETLRAMQAAHTREGRLDEALAIRARIRQLRGDLLGVRPDPGSLREFENDPGSFDRSFLFQVVGRDDGSVWGTDMYTTDSQLAAAAVHAGAVTIGERGLVRVTILDGAEYTYAGSTRNGVTTRDYENYMTAFRIDRV